MKKTTIYGSIVWVVTTIFVIYSLCLNTANTAYIEVFKAYFAATDIGITIAVGAFIVGFACMQIPAGYLLDRYNINTLVTSAVFLVAVGNLIISFSHNIYIFSLANLLQGVGASFDFIAASVLIAQWFSPRMFPILTGLIQTASCIFAGIGHYLFVLESQFIAWQTIYFYLSIFGFVLAVVCYLFVRSPAGYKSLEQDSFRKAFAMVSRHKQIWLCAIAAATSLGILLAYSDLWYVRVQKYYAVSELQTAIIGSMFLFGMALGPPILGWISNQVKSRKLILHLSLVLGNMLLILALYLPHFQIDTYIPIKIISFLTGFFLSGSMLFYTVGSEISSDKTRGLALSIINTGVFLFNSAMFLIPYLSITAISVEFFTYLWILPFCVMIAILLLYFIQESYKKNE